MNNMKQDYQQMVKLKIARRLKKMFNDPRSPEELAEFIDIDILSSGAIITEKISPGAIVEEKKLK